MFVWIALVTSALLGGSCFVAVLAVRRAAEPVAALLGIVSFGIAAYSLVVLSGSYERVDAAFYGLALAIAAGAGGWALGAALLERPPRTRPASLPDGRAVVEGKSAVVVCACMEPATYSASSTSGILHSLADEGLLEPSLGTLPFLYFAQKTRYRALGGTSPARAQLTEIADGLDAALEGDGVPSTTVATCAGPDRIAVRVAQAVAQGCEHVVVAPVTVADSLHLSAAKREVDALRAEAGGTRVTYLDPLHGAERLVDMLVARVLAATSDPATTGVALVGHGQPAPRARVNPSFDQQETAFLNRVRMRLADAGFAESHVRVAWAEWSEPDVTNSVRHLATIGCERILVVPAVHPFESIATLLDLELAVRQARVHDTVSVVTLPAWKNDPALAAELAQRVRAALAT